MEDMKILKEAHQKKEQPELQPEVRAAGDPTLVGELSDPLPGQPPSSPLFTPGSPTTCQTPMRPEQTQRGPKNFSECSLTDFPLN